MTDKKYVIKAQVCDVIVSTPLSQKEATRKVKDVRKKLPGAKVKVHRA